MSFASVLSIMISCIFVENFVLVKFYGICPFLGVSKKMSGSVGMGLAVIFVMTISSLITHAVDVFLLIPFEITYLRTIAFILIIAALVQVVEMFLHKFVPALYSSLGIYLPLITTNCAVLGSALVISQKGAEWGFIEAVLYGAFSGVGFMMALVIFSSVRERLEFSPCPKTFEGLPRTLIAAGLVAMAFMGFSGLKIF
ncbi:MAG: RnfABCDGE type electron transport complex subunit A [Clostridia bacterium]|nr:RnfABCDGE type electron transport complex subunit A [Clostridia bacterium]